MEFCSICKNYIYNNTEKHTCPPSWLCWMDGDDKETDSRIVFDYFEENAVRNFVELYDNETGGELISIHPMSVVVWAEKVNDPNSKPEKYRVYPEAIVTYYATKILSDEEIEENI